MAEPMKVIYQGREMTIPQLSRLTGVGDYFFYKYLKLGHDPEQIVAYAKTPRSERFVYQGDELTIRQLAAINNLTPSLMTYRLHNGWSVEDAINTPIGKRPGGAPPPKRAKLPERKKLPEGRQWNAAVEICRTIASSPHAFNFRCTEPMTEYAFESDLLGYRIRFLSPDRAQLTAYWRQDNVPSDLNRLYDVDGEKIKEVQPA